MASDPERSLALVATAAAGVFAGSALYITVVQQPALLRTNTTTPFRLAFFGSMFGVAAPMQASLAALSGATAISTGLLQRGRQNLDLARSPATKATLWMASGGLMVAIVPYTLAAMMKLNYKLLDKEHCERLGDEWTEASLKKWGRLHAVRTGLSMAAFTGMLVALSGAFGESKPAVSQL